MSRILILILVSLSLVSCSGVRFELPFFDHTDATVSTLTDTKNTATGVFDETREYSRGDSQSGIMTHVWYPVSSRFPSIETRLVSAFSGEIMDLERRIRTQTGGSHGGEYHGEFMIHQGDIWDTLVFEMTESIGTGSIHRYHTSYIVSRMTGEISGIEDIISERYLYTLARALEDSPEIHGSMQILPEYRSFSHFTREGDNLIFSIADQRVSLPVTSYFFDRYHEGSGGTQSGETTAHTHTGKKLIALTFDDGPSEKYTEKLLDILRTEGVHATFYVLGQNAKRYPNILKREYDEGHEIGNHSYSHAPFTRLTPRDIHEEVYKTDQVIYHTLGIYPRTLRPPYGAINDDVLHIGGLPLILWSIDPYDWRTKNVKKNIAAMQYVKEGSIILFHDIHETSVESIPEVIRTLRDRGFTFVTVSELLGITDDQSLAGKKCIKKGNCK